jgi:hypothetical protein
LGFGVKVVNKPTKHMNIVIEKLIIIKHKIRLKNLMYWLMMIVCVINSVVFVYKLLIDIQNVTALWQLGVPLDLALYSGVVGIMCEYHPTHTQYLRDRHDKMLDQGLSVIILLTILNTFVVIYAMHSHSH